MKTLKFTFGLILLMASHLSFGQWQLSGNNLTGTEKFGSINNQPLKFITNNKTRITLTNSGSLSFSSDQSSIQFALPGTTPKPMMFMFPSGTSNTPRMIFAHSPAFINFGLQYTDFDDRFDFLSAGTSIFNVNLGASSVGVNGTFSVVGNSAFTGNVNVTGLNTFGDNLGIKTSLPGVDLHLAHTTGEDSHHGFRLENTSANRNNWTLYTANNDGALVMFFGTAHAGFFDPVSGAYTATSDARRKKDIEEAPDVLNKIMQLNVKKYHFLENKSTDKKYYGMIAQDVEKVFPEVVYHRTFDGSNKDLYTMNQSAFGVIAIKAIQEQQKIIDSQKADIQELKTAVEQLREQVKTLSAGSNENSSTAQQKISLSSAHLKQNTPNPFNSATTINYYVPENKNAAIEITSANGQLIKAYSLRQKGIGQLIIEASALSPGTYYYTLKVDGAKIDSKQMLLVK